MVVCGQNSKGKKAKGLNFEENLLEEGIFLNSDISRHHVKPIARDIFMIGTILCNRFSERSSFCEIYRDFSH